MNTKSIINFLEKLSKNNNRDWFYEHKEEYEIAKKDFKEIVQSIILKISDFDEDISFVEVEKCIFRLNRDVRFSKDKTPYKNHFSAAISPTGRKGDVAFYYFQIDADPSRNVVAGGVWMPQKEALNNIRKYISNHYEEFEEILYDETFGKTFGDLSDDKLTRIPRGYEESHPAANFLRYKSFTVGKDLTKDEILSDKFEDKVIDLFKEMYPFVQFLKRAVK